MNINRVNKVMFLVHAYCLQECNFVIFLSAFVTILPTYFPANCSIGSRQPTGGVSDNI